MGERLIELRILGPFELIVNGRAVPIGSPKQRLVLAALAVEANRMVPLDHLVDAVWGDAPPATAETTLQSLVYRLRRLLTGVLASATAADAAAPRIAGREWGYALEAEPGLVDADRFTDVVGRARARFDAGDWAAAAAGFSEGLSLWRGPALADLTDFDFARRVATRLEEARLSAIEGLADAELAAGKPAAAQEALEPLVADHPLREAAWGRLMLALYRQSRQSDALRAYQQVRRILGEELGLEPGAELRRLERQILCHDPALDGGSSDHKATPVVGKHSAAPTPSTGTVAFLFTDIEASTQRWEDDGVGMGADLARHDEILRATVETSAGKVFAHTGDGLCAAFPTAAAALAAAVDGQRALAAEQWRAAGPLRVRMAVHAGAAEARGVNWVGPPLNRTARLLALAAGGQILCSRATADLAGDRLPEGVSLRDLGQHQLADLSRPEQVFGVEHPELAGSFAALRPGSDRHNLPEALTPFCGRARELEEIAGLLGSTRVLTLTGVGGAGKTRLAVELARRELDRYPDGARLVELAHVADAAEVPQAVAATLGLVSALGGGSDTVARLASWLAARQLLVVLDSCEHVIESVANLLEEILPGAPGVSVLATSREVLAVSGETTWCLPPLSLPPDQAESAGDLAGFDAVDLFCERATAAQPAFRLTDANAEAVGRICRRLDGIPLALELAAARIRVLGAHQLADRLDDRFRLLAAGARGGVPRHQTLKATMDWSWDLLPAPEQRALRRLSVLPSDFTLEAAEAVVGGGDPPSAGGFGPMELVARLVDKSLVVASANGAEVRYHLLETVRAYAAERLVEAGEGDQTRRALGDFCLAEADRAAAFGLHLSPSTFLPIRRNAASVRDSIEWFLSTGRRPEALRLMAVYFATSVMGGWGADVPALLARCLENPRPELSGALVECLVASRFFPLEQDAGPPDPEALREPYRLAETLGDPMVLARAQLLVGEALVIRGAFDEGRRLLRFAREGFAALGVPVGLAWTAEVLGFEAMTREAYDEARLLFEDGLSQVGCDVSSGYIGIDPWVESHLQAGLALVGAATGDGDLARTSAARAVAGARRFAQPGLLVMALSRATEAALVLGDEAGAGRPLAELLTLLRELGARRWVAAALEASIALVPVDGPETSALAARLLGAAEALRRSLGETADVVPIAERVAIRRGMIPTVIGNERFIVEVDRGRTATADQALRWASALLASVAPGRSERPSLTRTGS